MLWLYGLGAIAVSSILLYVAGEFLVRGLLRLSRYFRITEFAVAFFVMAFAASLPNLFVGITSALQGIPELSFGDIMGNNILILTVAVALSVFFASKRELPIEGDTIQDTIFMTVVAAVLPLILIADGLISRSDGLLLILLFAGYSYWLVSQQGRFSKVFDGDEAPPPRRAVMIEIGRVVIGVIILALAAQGVVYGASLLGAEIGLSLVLIGILITSFGGALPEIYFSVISARKGETGLIIGGLLGSIVIPATLVLGLVAIIHPIGNDSMSFPLVSRLFLVAIAVFFLYVAQSRKLVTWREALVLIGFYLLFLLAVFLL